MKIRTIITTAAGAAAVAGGLLLATGGAASATTTATLTAATPSGHAVTIERGVDDTTNVPTGQTDPTNGPIWAYDTMQRTVTWHPAADGQPGVYDVTVTGTGSYSAFASPITGKAWKGHGPLFEQITYTDVSTTDGSQPTASHIPAVSPNTLRSQGIVAELFGEASSSSNVQFNGTGHYVAIYGGIPGAPAGWYVQQG